MLIHVATSIPSHRSVLIAFAGNRVALYNSDDALRPTTLIAEIGTAYEPVGSLRVFPMREPLDLQPGVYTLAIDDGYAALTRLD